MLFNSPLFLFVFLPATLGLFYTLAFRSSFRAALAALVLCSLVFYGFWNPPYLLLLLVSILINFRVGGWLQSCTPQSGTSKTLLWAGLAFNLGMIGYYKYANFFVSAVGDISGHPLSIEQIMLPLGISFFTFQQITWLVDTYRGNSERFDLLEYTQFVTFFPQLIAGPIVHHHEMMPQFNRLNMLSRIPENLSVGLTLFLLGLFKKVVLADSVALHATPIFGAAESGVVLTLYEAWIGALAYSLQLYFDFSGYSDMAIGLARMFGITLPMNFQSPYKATSVIDFWRRWHMTLSRFLRDYVYIPLGGSRLGSMRRYTNIALTMLLGGLWHGAGWTFVAWGAMHGLYLVVNHGWRSLKMRAFASNSTRPSQPSSSANTPQDRHRSGRLRGRALIMLGILASQLLTLMCVVAAWVVFRAESFGAALSQLRSMFGVNGIALPAQLQDVVQTHAPQAITNHLSFGSLFSNELVSPSGAMLWILLTGFIALVAPNSQQLLIRFRPVLETVARAKGHAGRLQWTPNAYWAVLVSVMALYTLLHLTSVSEFLYFQF